MELLAAVGGPLLGVVAALVFLIQRNSARYEAATAKARVTELSDRLTSDAAAAQDTWGRLSRVISDLKGKNAELSEKLNAYAAKDPVLAGDLLSDVLHSSSAVAPASSQGLPSSPSSSGGSGTPKQEG